MNVSHFPATYHVNMYHSYVHGTKCDQASKKGPSLLKIHHTTKSYEFCVPYLLYRSCKMLPIKLLIDGKNFTSMTSADH